MTVARVESHEFSRISPGRKAMLWSLFFLICIGFGYPTLNRYDARTVAGLYDTRAYYALVTGDPLQEDQTDLGHRILVPYLAKPIYWLVNGRLKTWNPVFFALLTVNSFFIATTVILLVDISFKVVGDNAVALVAGFIYLADFCVANFNLSGYVDSAVNCMLIAVVWALLTERWWLLPFWGMLGALAKETFVPLSAVLAFAWWVAARRRGAFRFAQLAWIASMAAIGFVVLIFLMSRGAQPYSPISFAASRYDPGAGRLYLSGLIRCLLAREFLFTFAWLLPLGQCLISRLPKTWVAGSTCAALAALAMGAYDDALGNATRAIFSACGPLLSLSISLLLVESKTSRL